MRIGVLALQGNFAEHEEALRKTSEKLQKNDSQFVIEVVEIRDADQVSDELDGLIIPGGESPTLTVAMRREGFLEKLKVWTQRKDKFTWGTCAGLIMLSNRLEGSEKFQVTPIGGLDITCVRNAIGRQNESFEGTLRLIEPGLCALSRNDNFHGIFIRAPGIKSVDDASTDVLCVLPNRDVKDGDVRNDIVAVRKGNLMACTFHPELTGDTIWHEYFLQMVARGKSIEL